MKSKLHSFIAFLSIIALFQLVVTTQANAYIGPGIAVVGVWSLFGPIAALVMLFLMIGYYPARYLYKKHKKAKEGNAENEEASESNIKQEAAPAQETTEQ